MIFGSTSGRNMRDRSFIPVAVDLDDREVCAQFGA